MERRLDGKVALVTGSGGLIGPAVVRRLAAEGAAVAVTDLSLESAEKLAAGITAAGGRAFAAALDVTNPEGIASVFEAAERALGPLDILVNNAGLLRKQSAPLQQTPVETMKAIIDVNLIGTMLCCREAVGGMIARGYGKIINVASMTSFFGSERIPAYAASKGGVAQLTKALANEWTSRGVCVNAIAPGYMETALTKDIKTTNPRYYEEITGRIPAHRWGKLVPGIPADAVIQ